MKILECLPHAVVMRTGRFSEVEFLERTCSKCGVVSIAFITTGRATLLARVSTAGTRNIAPEGAEIAFGMAGAHLLVHRAQPHVYQQIVVSPWH